MSSKRDARRSPHRHQQVPLKTRQERVASIKDCMTSNAWYTSSLCWSASAGLGENFVAVHSWSFPRPAMRFHTATATLPSYLTLKAKGLNVPKSQARAATRTGRERMGIHKDSGGGNVSSEQQVSAFDWLLRLALHVTFHGPFGC